MLPEILNNMEKKVLLVVRVSSDVQDTDSQKEALKQHLIRKGLDEKKFIYLEEEGENKKREGYLALSSSLKQNNNN